MRHLFVVFLMLCVSGVGVAADPRVEWKLPEAEGTKWVVRVKKAVSRLDWTVKIQGNEITVQKDKLVAMERTWPGAPAGIKQKPAYDGERKFQFVLRFTQQMSMEEYDRLMAVNEASEKEYRRTMPVDKSAPNYQAAKLPYHTLPDLYTMNHSIYLFHPYDGSSPSDEEVSKECLEVNERLLRLFGAYDSSRVPYDIIGQSLDKLRK
ncbi:MAG: hypothetical protein ACRC8S_09840 [Fimbriiglobus sp.]